MKRLKYMPVGEDITKQSKGGSFGSMIINDRESVHITYLGGGWPTNIGNAFIDLGSIYSLKKACPNSIIHFISDISGSEFEWHTGSINNCFMLTSKIQADYLVLSGTLLSRGFINRNGREIMQLLKSNENIKIIINGGGGSDYSKTEVSAVQKFLGDINPHAFISRDSVTFQNYQHCALYSHDGIDCGFFVSDCFTPAKLSLPEFIVLNFDDISKEKYVPKQADKMIIRTQHSVPTESLPTRLIPIYNRLISIFSSRLRYFYMPNTLISDIPDDYLNLYANTKATYSTRVHACVATLAFCNPAMLFAKTPRANLFDKVGASSIKEKLTYADMQKMSDEKSKHIKFLSKVIEQI